MIWLAVACKTILAKTDYFSYSAKFVDDDVKFPCLLELIEILQYRLRIGFSLLYKSVFHLNCLMAQLSYEGRAAVEGAK
jgi:hypothetical protein